LSKNTASCGFNRVYRQANFIKNNLKQAKILTKQAKTGQNTGKTGHFYKLACFFA